MVFGLSQGVKFSQFVDGGVTSAGDTIVGLRDGVNEKFGALSGTTSIIIDVTQTAHGFTAGQILTLGVSGYYLSQANNAVNANSVGMVVGIISANVFQLQMLGYVSGLSGLTAKSVYFLDASIAGAMTLVPPSTAGQILKPVFISDTTTSGFFVNYNGQQL